MNIKSCCVTERQDISVDKLEYVKSELEREILLAVKDGYTHFISGFDQGTGLIFASIVADLMEEYSALTLEAAIPYRGRMDTLDPLFHQLLGKCQTIGIHSEEYKPSCFRIRNRFMVSHSQRVIEVYDGSNAGGTFFTVWLTQSQFREVRIIRI